MNNCPLSYFVQGMPRMVVRGYACTYTGGHCKPSEKCAEWIAKSDTAQEIDHE